MSSCFVRFHAAVPLLVGRRNDERDAAMIAWQDLTLVRVDVFFVDVEVGHPE